MLERWIAWTLGAGQRACTLSEVSNQGCAVIQPLFLHSFTQQGVAKMLRVLGAAVRGGGRGGVTSAAGGGEGMTVKQEAGQSRGGRTLGSSLVAVYRPRP